MRNYLGSTIKKYVKELSRRTITPGGGSAAAFVASLGAALNLMVINYSLKGKRSDKRNQALLKIKSRQEKWLKRILPQVDKDCKVFRELMQALSLNKRAIQKRYIAAAKVPLFVSACCKESLKITNQLRSLSNKNLMTDVDCAAFLLKAAFYSARVNVEINLKAIKNRAFVNKVKKELKLLCPK